MSTLVIKKKKHEPIAGKKTAKVSKYAFGPAVRRMAGVVNTGIGNLSMREGFGD